MKWIDDYWHFTISAENAFGVVIRGAGCVVASSERDARKLATENSENTCNAQSLKFRRILEFKREPRNLFERLLRI